MGTNTRGNVYVICCAIECLEDFTEAAELSAEVFIKEWVMDML